MLGLTLRDDTLVEQGVERLEEAAFMSNEPGIAEFHWPNFLKILERLLKDDHPRAKTWSESVASRAAKGTSEALLVAHRESVFPRVRDHWTSVAPQLMTLIDDDSPGGKDRR